MDDLQIAFIVISSVLGAVVSAVLGWTESTDSFDVKKFGSSLIRGIIGAVLMTGAYYFGSTTTTLSIGLWDYIATFLGGAGFDALLKRAQGAVTSKTTPTPPTT